MFLSSSQRILKFHFAIYQNSSYRRSIWKKKLNKLKVIGSRSFTKKNYETILFGVTRDVIEYLKGCQLIKSVELMTESCLYT